MIAVQKRSGKRHLVHPDGLATRCGRTLYRHNWRIKHGRSCDCGNCWSALSASLRKEDKP